MRTFSPETTVATKLIELDNEILIEIEVPPNEAQKISGGLADRVNATLDKIRPILLNTCRPIIAAWNDIGKEIDVDRAEIELGLSFEGEGNLYITKSKAGANLTVKLVLKPRE
jgi:hypothetical protein